MSFTGDVKNELIEHVTHAKHCNIAELCAIMCSSSKIYVDKNGRIGIKLQTDSEKIRERLRILLNEVCVVNDVSLSDDEAQKVMNVCHLNVVLSEKEQIPFIVFDPVVVERSCCKRAFLRGMFLSGGSVTDPSKGYHFEIVSDNEENAQGVADILISFDMNAKITLRKGKWVVYVKGADQISELLSIMEAHVSMMAFENERILKEVRNNVNRSVNCDTANIKKTADAAMRQISDIKYIEEHIGLSNLPEGLQMVANLRLQNPDATLTELAELSGAQIGKSGINHRLKKLSEIAGEHN